MDRHRAPSSGSWAVKDSLLIDPQTGELATIELDRWEVSGATHTIDWTWGRGSTDGGAFRGLGGEFSFTITPRFNEAAALWGVKNTGRITDWQFLSWSGGELTRHRMALDRAVTVRSGGCAGRHEVEIDVVPGSASNRLNLRRNRTIPVAIHGSDAVTPADVDVTSLSFGASDAIAAGGGARTSHDGHGEDPLIVHFPIDGTGFSAGDTEGVLVGRSVDGTQIFGTDVVEIVGDSEERGEDGAIKKGSNGADENAKRSEDERGKGKKRGKAKKRGKVRGDDEAKGQDDEEEEEADD